MFSKDVINKIVDNVINDMSRYNIKPTEYDIYLDNRINYEIKKIEKNDNNKIAIYDNSSNIADTKNFNIVLEDFIGKDSRLNVYNSTEDKKYYKYNKNNMESETVHYIFQKNKYNLIHDVHSLFSSFCMLSKKYFPVSIIFILNKILSIILKSFNFIIFGLINLFVYFLFRMFKLLIRVKYYINKRNKMLFFLINPFIGITTAIIKIVINTINTICYLFNRFFNNSIEFIFDFINNSANNILYSNKLKNDKVNRDHKSQEQKELIEKIKQKSLLVLQEYLQNSQSYIKNFNFMKMSVKENNPNLINNEALKNYFITIREQEKQNIKNKIIKKHFNIIKNNINKNIEALLNKENKIMLNNINKNKKIFDDLSKSNNNSMERYGI